MESVSTEVLGKNKEHYLRSGDKAKQYDILRQILSYMSKYKKTKIYIPLCQTYIPTIVCKPFSKKWTNMQEASD